MPWDSKGISRGCMVCTPSDGRSDLSSTCFLRWPSKEAIQVQVGEESYGGSVSKQAQAGWSKELAMSRAHKERACAKAPSTALILALLSLRS